MKSITNTRCLVMWALLAFYLFFIVSYYFSKFSEGLDNNTPESVPPESVPPPSTKPIAPSKVVPMSSISAMTPSEHAPNIPPPPTNIPDPTNLPELPPPVPM